MKRFTVQLGVLLTCALLSAGAFAADKVSPTNVDGAVSVDTGKAKELFDNGILFVDVRSNKDWDAGRIPGSEHLELKKIFTEASFGELMEGNKGMEVVLYCNGPKCLRSSNAAKQAVEWGYSKVYYYRDGFPAWQGAGNPVE